MIVIDIIKKERRSLIGSLVFSLLVSRLVLEWGVQGLRLETEVEKEKFLNSDSIKNSDEMLESEKTKNQKKQFFGQILCQNGYQFSNGSCRKCAYNQKFNQTTKKCIQLCQQNKKWDPLVNNCIKQISNKQFQQIQANIKAKSLKKTGKFSQQHHIKKVELNNSLSKKTQKCHTNFTLYKNLQTQNYICNCNPPFTILNQESSNPTCECPINSTYVNFACVCNSPFSLNLNKDNNLQCSCQQNYFYSQEKLDCIKCQSKRQEIYKNEQTNKLQCFCRSQYFQYKNYNSLPLISLIQTNNTIQSKCKTYQQINKLCQSQGKYFNIHSKSCQIPKQCPSNLYFNRYNSKCQYPPKQYKWLVIIFLIINITCIILQLIFGVLLLLYGYRLFVTKESYFIIQNFIALPIFLLIFSISIAVICILWSSLAKNLNYLNVGGLVLTIIKTVLFIPETLLSISENTLKRFRDLVKI